ncbi:unnamed protein product [Clavelina lepadiformis]|uniref:BHLH domain-containing protein n=1 Tax=Clavelina lepadiformis TaxID=159417 RepID=A0ABP0FD72_CLALP
MQFIGAFKFLQGCILSSMNFKESIMSVQRHPRIRHKTTNFHRRNTEKKKSLRTMALKAAFARLRGILPDASSPEKEMTEYEILQKTVQYIIYLNDILHS